MRGWAVKEAYMLLLLLSGVVVLGCPECFFGLPVDPGQHYLFSSLQEYSAKSQMLV